MKTPLVNIKIKSIYKVGNTQVDLPIKLAKCTPDTNQAIISISNDLSELGGELILSDLFRSYDMQYQANMDYVSGKKKAYSPPPGGSMHEAGRAMDIDLGKIKVTLEEFWNIAKKYGFYPIISKPSSKLKEAWHFDCRGSHGLVYEYYKSGKANNMPAYTAMAVSGILATGIKVKNFKGHDKEAFIQSGLIRLGYEIGNIDGDVGKKTKAAFAQAGFETENVDDCVDFIELLLFEKFPNEY